MFGFDEWVVRLGGGSVTMALFVAVLLGLRHATDPDHLTALSTLVLGEQDRRTGARTAGELGMFWGLGHATTLVAFGLPLILFKSSLPLGVQRAAEVAVGVLIVVLALRLLLRWRRGTLHSHPHEHEGKTHAHPHVHEHPSGGAHPVTHRHGHAERVGRTPLAAFGIGLVHGVGGSAGAGVLLVAAVPGHGAAILALLLFAVATAFSMAAVSAVFGSAIARGARGRRIEALVPAFGAGSLLFGVWYAAAALAG
jgi:ABC-type nickel/cobalt efflux system permease component RcnA